ncbi:HYC_CC_PP family protein [Sinomicrobium weinanense]|uniref:Uncharacterized protein n=1 Tax=Sinomicrobium weinanense TaxID=2842200 RepID=A0A926Q0J5_9FLAO|nr:hypothetical protein [Sinomicrobium weinanense]MBC9794977.1 hypothetical protein [Sinomicrobium weinanense]MBU3125162.1 hypothetical protein [Sinomicrobium weinanense]
MKGFIHKIAAVFMTFVVLLSTMSFTINMHCCGDSIRDISLLDKAEACSMDMQKSLTTPDCTISSEDCCSDKCIVIEGQGQLKPTSSTTVIEQQAFVAAFIYTYLNLFEGLEKGFVPFRDYEPPLLTSDVQVLYETYLI